MVMRRRGLTRIDERIKSLDGDLRASEAQMVQPSTNLSVHELGFDGDSCEGEEGGEMHCERGKGLAKLKVGSVEMDGERGVEGNEQVQDMDME